MATDERTLEPVIIVYYCPTEGCGNYFASSAIEGQKPLEEQWSTDLTGQRTHTRARCPRCGVTRVRRYARLVPEGEFQSALAEARRRVTRERDAVTGAEEGGNR